MKTARSIRSTRGLTLIEIIVTIAILGGFMTLLSFHLVGLSNIWLQGADDDFFDQHVDGVTLFLNNAFASSEPPADGDQTGPVQWARPPAWSEADDPLLHFRHAEAPALFVQEGRPLPAIRAYLHFEERSGLSVIWYSELADEEPESTNDLLNTGLSTFVSKIEYAYYDRERERWELTERPLEEDNDEFILPHFLRLTFNHEAHGERKRSVLIPQQAANVPMF